MSSTTAAAIGCSTSDRRSASEYLDAPFEHTTRSSPVTPSSSGSAVHWLRPVATTTGMPAATVAAMAARVRGVTT